MTAKGKHIGKCSKANMCAYLKKKNETKAKLNKAEQKKMGD